MPHNLYLHSNLVISKSNDDFNVIDPKDREKVIRSNLKMSNYDSFIALMLALFMNSAILIVSSANFYSKGRHDIADIPDAYELIARMIGQSAATLFAVALLFAGQSSTVTGTLAGQVVMEGELNLTTSFFAENIFDGAMGPTFIDQMSGHFAGRDHDFNLRR